MSDVPREMSTDEINLNDTDFTDVNYNEVKKAINKLKKGSAPWPDGLSSENFLYGGDKLQIHIAVLFSALLKYAFIPEDL